MSQVLRSVEKLDSIAVVYLSQINSHNMQRNEKKTVEIYWRRGIEENDTCVGVDDAGQASIGDITVVRLRHVDYRQDLVPTSSTHSQRSLHNFLCFTEWCKISWNFFRVKYFTKYFVKYFWNISKISRRTMGAGCIVHCNKVSKSVKGKYLLWTALCISY